MQTQMALITPGQISKLWYEAKQLGLTDIQVHEMLQEQFRIDSVKKLTKIQAISFIDRLVDYTGNTKHRAGMASPMQLWRIEDIRKKLGWEPNGIKGFIKKYSHVEDLKWLTDKAASKVITGLTKVLQAKEKKDLEEIGGDADAK